VSKFPKGARWFSIADGDVRGPIKSTHPKSLRELFYDNPHRNSTASHRYVVVQARGRMMWSLFKRANGEPVFVDRNKQKDPLIMRAALGVD
jgi:hypothetical protein